MRARRAASRSAGFARIGPTAPRGSAALVLQNGSEVLPRLPRGAASGRFRGMRSAPQSLLLRVPCPACGRPSRELSSCPWCGERASAAPRTRGDIARLVVGLALVAVAAGTAAATGTAVNTVAPAVPAGMAAAGLLCGLFLVRPPPSRFARQLPQRGSQTRDSSAHSAGPLLEGAPGDAGWGSLSSAAIVSLLSLALRACAVPYPIPIVQRFAWTFPALAAAFFALRVPAEAPNAPAFGASSRERALRRHAPDLVAALSLSPFAALFAASGPSLLSLVALALVLGVWLARLSRPAVPLLLSALGFTLLLPDPAFFALGLVLAALQARHVS